MNERTRQGLHVVAAALVLGVLGDALLRATPWGLNFFLFVGALTAAACALLKHYRRAALKGEGGWLLLPILLFAAACAWRDSTTLKGLDLLMVACSLALLAWRASGASLKLAGLAAYAHGLAQAFGQTIFGGFPLVFADVRWGEIPRNGWTRHALAIARGLLIAVPLLVVFGALFMAADAVFEGLINRTFRFDGETLVSHGLLFTLFAWLTAGYFRGLLFGGTRKPVLQVIAQHAKGGVDRLRDVLRTAETSSAPVLHAPMPATHEFVAPPASITEDADVDSNAERKQDAHSGVADETPTAAPDVPTRTQPEPSAAPTARRFALGVVEVGVVLGLLDALFLGFVCVQVRYLFGGATWVAQTGGLTYAEYARRGFFELVWATALVLPLLLALHWLLRADDRAAQRLFRALASAQIVLLFVIIASALTRMRLYQSEYGLTELRLYTTAFMGWLALVFVWFAATVLRGARERFACGAFVTACFIIAALHLVNPDATIVRTNVAHAHQGRAFDALYATSLSADAVPTLVSALPSLTQDARCFAARELLAQWSAQGATDWRAWSVARGAAWRAVAQQEASLRAWACALPVNTTATAPVAAAPLAPNEAALPAAQSAPTLPPARTPMTPAGSAPAATINGAIPATPRATPLKMSNQKRGTSKGSVRW